MMRALARSIEIEPMRRRDVRSVVRIENLVHTRPWSASLYRRELTTTVDRTYLVAREARTVVGYGGLLVLADAGHIATLAVAPSHRRRRIGSRVLLALARDGIERGVSGLTLEVRASNDAAQRLYEKFGFYVAGVRKGYYAEVKEDGLVMWADEVQSAAYRDLLGSIERHLDDPSSGEPAAPNEEQP